MGRPRKSRQQQQAQQPRQPQHAASAPSSASAHAPPRSSRDTSPSSPASLARGGPFGAWSQADLRALPRFPHQDSFPTAKTLIDRCLQGWLPERDLRIALFWLGFGLFGPCVQVLEDEDEPTLRLVPLCKDLDAYVDSAVELGYDPQASVHARPMCLAFEGGCTPRSAEVFADPSCSSGAGVLCQPGPSSSSSCTGWRADGVGEAASSSSGYPSQGRPASSGGRASAGSSATLQRREAWPEEGIPSERALPTGFSPATPDRRSCRGKWPEEESPWLVDDDSEDSGSEGGRPDGACLAGSSQEPGGRARDSWLSSGGAASSRAWVPGRASSVENEDAGTDAVGTDADAALALQYKVKLLHAGGWSESSGSEGRRTPPTPPPAGASSSAAMSTTGKGDSWGLNADHVAQFTVSFVADPQVQEDMEDVSCLCTFCLDEMQIGEELCRLPCMHTFHRSCAHAWLERDRRCMLCRLDITRPRG